MRNPRDTREALKGTSRADDCRELRAELQELRAELSTGPRGELASKAALDAAMKSLRDELRTHFEVVTENLRSDIRNMVDWLKANHDLGPPEA